MGIAKRNAKFGKSTRGGLASRNGTRTTQQRLSNNSRQSMVVMKPLVLKRDNYTCSRCRLSKERYPDIILTVDHIIPVARGGRNNLGNLVCLCIDCHIKKLGSTNRKGAKLLIKLKERIELQRLHQ